VVEVCLCVWLKRMYAALTTGAEPSHREERADHVGRIFYFNTGTGASQWCALA
jgi:hypothetical protein